MSSLFLKKLLKFIAPLLLLPLAVVVTDPFDYLQYAPKLNLDRMHTVRNVNVADWALSEVGKINKSSKARVSVVSIGDSRGRMLMSGGFEKGWKGRVHGANQKEYDLSFGGADLQESFSLLYNQLPHLDSLKTIVIVLPIDRILTLNQHRNRIESSSFISGKSHLKYLSNFKQLSYLLNPNLGKGDVVKQAEAQVLIQKQFLESFNTTSRTIFDKNLSIFMTKVTKLKSKYAVVVIIPPYEKSFFKELMVKHKADYAYYLQKIKTYSIPVIDLQTYESEFHFLDPVHGALNAGNIKDFIRNKAHVNI